MRAARRLRWLVLALIGLPLLYLLIAGTVLARFAGGILTPGSLGELNAEAPSPTDPLELGYRGDPANALDLPFVALTIMTDLGPAPAWYVPGDQPLAAIYVHGIGGAREDGYRHLSMLAAAGHPTLLITYRNDADAPADPPHAFGLTEWRDLQAAVDAMALRGHERLIIVAESMGGAIAGQFLHQSDRADRIVALALDSPALSFRETLAQIGRLIGLPLPRPVAVVAHPLLSRMTGLDLARAEVLDVVAGFRGPVFLAHGTGDRIVPVSISDALIMRHAGPLVTFRNDGDHLQTWHRDPAGYRAAFGEFLASLPE